MMKDNRNSSIKNLVFVCCAVIAAALLGLSTIHSPETGGGMVEAPVQTGGNDDVTMLMGNAGSTAEDLKESEEAILGAAESAEWLYSFRNERLLNQHYEKHGIEMGFATIEEYVAAANAVINHPDVLHKQEAEDNDDVYFLEATSEFVVVSTDGFIRTYFIASGGIDYYNRQ